MGSQTDVAFHGVHSTFIDVLQGKLLQTRRLDAAMAIENCKGGVSRKESMKESQEEKGEKEEEEEEEKEDEYNMSYKSSHIRSIQ